MRSVPNRNTKKRLRVFRETKNLRDFSTSVGENLEIEIPNLCCLSGVSGVGGNIRLGTEIKDFIDLCELTKEHAKVRH